MTDIQQLRDETYQIITKEQFQVEDLRNILKPVSDYWANRTFLDNLERVVEILTKDRDGNNQFTINDLKCLGKDVLALTSLISTVVLVVNSVPNLKMSYTADETEFILTKVLLYVFLCLVPKKTGKNWSNEDKGNILDLILSIHAMLRSSVAVQAVVNKVGSLFKSSGLCSCVSSPNDPDTVFEKHAPKLESKLEGHIVQVKNTAVLYNEIETLKAKLDSN